MTFLNPLVLLGLIAAGIPLLVHLFQFQRPKTVDFSSVAFIKALEESTMRRTRVKRWLLLALRTLAIVFLVLGFSRPTLTGPMAQAVGGDASASVALVVDNSLSMTLRGAGESYLGQAQKAAGDIVQQTKANDQLWVTGTAGEAARQVTRFTDQRGALKAIGEFSAAADAEPLARAVVRTANRLAEGQPLNKEIYLLSDLQRTTLVDSLNAKLPSQTRVTLVPVSTKEHANVAVTDVRLVSRILEADQPVRMEATLANYGSKTLEAYAASVYLGEERVAQATARLEPGTQETVTFTVTPKQRGWLAGHVAIETDAYVPDNKRSFTLHIPERREILFVKGEGQSTSFAELALSPRLTTGEGAFEHTVIEERQLPSHNLQTADVVVLVGPKELSSGEIKALTRYMEAGGGILLFPGQQANPADYNAWFSRINAGKFTGFTGSLGAGQPVASTERVDLEHPMFQTMFSATADVRSRQLESVSVLFAMNYTPGKGNEQTLIHLSNGFPFLQEVQYGKGRLLIMGVAPHPSWSDLPVRGLFVPLMYRSAYYLASSTASQQAAYTLGTTAEVQVERSGSEPAFRVVSPTGQEFIPEQQMLLGTVRLQLTDLLTTPGIYDIFRGDQLVRRMAFNPSVGESNLAVWDGQTAASRLEEFLGQRVYLLEKGLMNQPGGLAETVRQQRFGVELWNVFLMLALACLAGEMIIAAYRPSTQPKNSKEPLSVG